MGIDYLTPLTPRVYWSPPDDERDRPIMGAVIGDRSTLVIEAGASRAHAAQFREALQTLGGPLPRYVALTHWHWDHVFGIAEWDLPTFAHRETRQRIAEMGRLDWSDAALDARVASGQEIAFIADHVKVELTEAERAELVIAAPDIIFDDRLEIDLGGVTCQIIHVGGDHASDSAIIFIPEERVVFLGDCPYPAFSGDDRYYTPGRIFPLLEKLAALPADYYLFSHQAPPTPRAEFLAFANELQIIGLVVAETGSSRQAAVQRLESKLGAPLDEDQEYYLDAFLRGMLEDIQ